MCLKSPTRFREEPEMILEALRQWCVPSGRRRRDGCAGPQSPKSLAERLLTRSLIGPILWRIRGTRHERSSKHSRPCHLGRRQPRRHPHHRDAGRQVLRLDVPGGPHAGVRHGRVGLADLGRHRRRGQAHASDVGDVHHHLRVLDWDRTRGHADLCHPVSVPREVAHLHLSRAPRP